MDARKPETLMQRIIGLFAKERDEENKIKIFPKCETMEQAEELANKVLDGYPPLAPFLLNARPVLAAVFLSLGREGREITGKELWQMQDDEIQQRVADTPEFTGDKDWYKTEFEVTGPIRKGAQAFF